MSALRQIAAVSAVGLGGLRERFASGLVIVIGMACVVGVLTSMLSVTAGLRTAYLRPADTSRAVVWWKHAEFEESWEFAPDEVATVLDAPGIAKAPGGALLGDAEFVMPVPVEGFSPGSLLLRGMGPAGAELHPGFRTIAGHAVRPGRRELVVGVGAARKFGLHVGSEVRLLDGGWPIVGAFSSDGDIIEGYLVGDSATLMSARRRARAAEVVVQLTDAKAYPAFKRWLEENPAISVSVERKSDYDRRVAGTTTAFFTRMALIIVSVMALGAVFGIVKIMYAAVRSRTYEIGTLRALGFGATPIAVSVILEALLLSVVGATIGTAIAWWTFDGHEMWVWGTFRLRIPLQLWMSGLLWAIGAALLGGLFPAVRAVRLAPVDALRTE